MIMLRTMDRLRKRELLRLHGHWLLRLRFTPKAIARRKLAGLATDELFWAYRLPDHTAFAREEALATLINRGFARDEVQRWLPTADTFMVPNADRAADAQTLRERRALRRWMYWSVRPLFLSAIVLMFFALNHEDKMNQEAVNRAIAERRLDGSAYRQAASQTGIDQLNRELVKRLSLTTRASPFWDGAQAVALSAIALTFFGILLQPPLTRVLVLRPFRRRHRARAISRLLDREARFYGSLITLSDQYLRESRVTTVLQFVFSVAGNLGLLILGLAFRMPRSPLNVRSERRFRSLKKLLLRRWRNRALWTMSGGRALVVRTTDEWWQDVVRVLIHSCEIIILDVSEPGPGLDWEINTLRRLGLTGKTIVMAEMGTPASDAAEVHRYDASGTLVDAMRFQEALAIAHSSWRVPPASSARQATA
jgi:hypothetical protein